MIYKRKLMLKRLGQNLTGKRIISAMLLIRLMKVIFCVFIIGIPFSYAQVKMSTWDDTVNKYWPAGFEEIDIQSKADGTIQKAVFCKSTLPGPQPLIISLHTWSGDYRQEDPLAEEVKLRNWHYIHPDFRGPNNRPEACGSDLVISDLEDAIEFAVTTCEVDTGNIHIIGVSGGGYTALMAYLKLNRPVKSYHAWVPVSNLSDWYWESIGRKNRYAEDLEKIALIGAEMNWKTLENRSPLSLKVPKDKWQNTSLHLYAGIHDGYTGAVPISHSIDFYNKMVLEIKGQGSDDLVTEQMKSDLIIKRTLPNFENSERLFDRVIHLKKEISGLSLTVFEGGHEMLVGPALALLPIDELKCLNKFNILTVGDSNGASEHGWPVQMKKIMPFSNIINVSIAGNTIGFDNLDQEKLNTLKNIDQYLEEAVNSLPHGASLDFIFFGLGTNDAKAVFSEQQQQVILNLEKLVTKTKYYFASKNLKLPVICLISPPPVDPSKYDKEKYGGSEIRILQNSVSFENVCRKLDIDYLNIYNDLNSNSGINTDDGIHLKPNAQFEIARIIVSYVKIKMNQ